ncbi:MAG: hypothetical protein K0U10_03705, partial [Gammaproteobacteria bacterium]|nr:hypothetical protein [Gammaproteobacteria bacterium]
PLLLIQETRDTLMGIGQQLGEKDKLAGAVANEIIKDLQMATSYPPEHSILTDPFELSDSVKVLVHRINEARDKVSK